MMSIEERLEFFRVAWREKDVEATLGCFTENGVYAASVGPEPGTRAEGKPAIRKLLEKMFDFDAGSEAIIEDKVLMTEAAYWKWRYERPDGKTVLGCDFFLFEGDRIALKDAFRKQFYGGLAARAHL